MNKNVSVWRGSKTPPTNYHVWINEENDILLHNGSDWDHVIDPDAYETLLDYLQHKEDSPKIDVTNEIPNGNDFKNGEFLLYKLGKDITISSPECYEFGKTSSFTIREGDLCLIGKVKHTPTLLEAEHPKFSDKYKYKIRFDANLDYYFGGTGNVGDPVLTTTTQPLTYSLIGSEDKFIIKCGNYYAFISGERLSLTNQLSNATHFVLHELESNKFELLNYNSQSLGLNAHQGLGTDGDYSDEIHWYDAGRPGNIVLFLPQENELIIKKVISTQEATTSYSGLMSKEDKAKLNSIASNANNYSLPAASSSTRGGIKIGYTSSANNRAVQLSSEKAYVYIPNATTSQSGLMSSSDKNKLDNSSAYKHVFTGLSALASSGDGWYHIIDLGDTEAAIVQISTGGHSDVQLAISSGWGGDDSASLNVLNSLLRGNPNYAYVKAVRIRKHKNGDSGYLRLEAKLNRTDYTDAKYRTTVVSVLTNANHNPIVTSDTTDKKHLLLLVTTTSETLLLEINLVDLAMIVKNIVADNLATVATSGNYNDLKNKPSTASTTTDGLMSASDKQKIDAELDIHKINEPAEFDFNMYTEQGVYNFHCMADAINSPVNSSGEIKGRLTVLSVSYGNSVITQVVNLNNGDGGEGNIYIRSCQNGTWKPWSKLQTNVEVGLVTLAALDNDPFLDNGIFSGICGDTGETFVLICINNYAVAPQNKSIAQLKYSLFIGSQDGLTPGSVKIEKRSRNTTGFWTDWENIGSDSLLTEATTEVAGAVKLGKSTNGGWFPICNIDSNHGSGLGLEIDSAVFLNNMFREGVLGLKIATGGGLQRQGGGLAINLGTTLDGSSNAVPLCIGTSANSEEFIGFTQSSTDRGPSMVPSIPVNPNQFKLGGLGLELLNPSSATKVTWDASSNMNDFKTPGVYDIYGERTVKTDNLPITNDGSGHSIAARLTVVASTLQPANNEICVTQFLQLSNRIGGEGAAYVRTYNENNNGMSDWSAWSKLQTNTEVGLIDSSQLKDFRDNGIYSGVVCGSGSYSSMLYDGAYFKKASTEQSEMIKQIGLSMGMSAWQMAYCYVYYAGNTKYQGCAVGANEDIAASDAVNIHLVVYPNGTPERFEEGAFCSVVYNNSNDVDLNNETFVLVNINNYAVAGAYSKVRSISQFKYGVDLDGNINFKKRLGTGNDAISWGDWENIDGVGSQEVDITDAVKAQYLPTLIEQGLVKEGITYKVSQQLGYVNDLKLDVGNKVVSHIAENGSMESSDVTFYITIKTINGHKNIIIDCYNDWLYYKYIINPISDTYNHVSVSADVTTL